MKKFTVAVITGIILGIFCFIAGKYILNLPFTGKNLGFIILNRAMIGFVIGISSLKMNWILHGALIGIVVGSIFAYADFLFGFPVHVVLLIIAVNPFMGIIIEFVSRKFIDTEE